MISIIKIITDEHKPFKLGAISSDDRAAYIRSAENRIIICTSGLSSKEADAIIEIASKKKLKIFTVYIDGDFDKQVKSADVLEANKKLIEANIDIKRTYGWEIGILVIDNSGYIYEFKDSGSLTDGYNCLILDVGETETIIQSIFEYAENNQTEPGENKEEGQDEQNKQRQKLLKDINNKLEELRKQSLYEELDSEYEFIEVNVDGLKLLNRTIPLKSNLFEFVNKDAEDKFRASYKIFSEEDHKSVNFRSEDVIKQVRQHIDKIRNKYTKVTRYGSCIKREDEKEFEKEIIVINEGVFKKLKEYLGGNLEIRLQKSKKALKGIFLDLHKKKAIRLKGGYDFLTNSSSKGIEEQIDAVIDSLKFPSINDLFERLEIKWFYKRLSRQLCEKDDFLSELKKSEEKK